MIDIESKIISCREDTNDYRLCLTREEIEEIKNMRANIIDRLRNDFNIAMIELKSFANNPNYAFDYGNYKLVEKTFAYFEEQFKEQK